MRRRTRALDDLDKELEKRGHRFVRYADDCNIYVRSERAGMRVMGSVKAFLTRKLKLKVNEEKSAVSKTGDASFWGFALRPAGSSSGRSPRRRLYGSGGESHG